MFHKTVNVVTLSGVEGRVVNHINFNRVASTEGTFNASAGSNASDKSVVSPHFTRGQESFPDRTKCSRHERIRDGARKDRKR